MRTPTIKLIIIALSVLLALGLAEIGLRLSGLRLSASFYELDFVTGWKLRPGATGWYTSEGEALIEINAEGMRDKPRARAKPPGALRVAVIGDSFVESMQLPIEKTFPALMEPSLTQCTGKRSEVLNFGVTGYGTAQELLTYRHKARLFSPDIVVLTVFAGNDLFNNTRDLNPTNADAAPYFRLAPNGALEFVEPFSSGGKPGPVSLWLRDRFRSLHSSLRLVQLATEAYYNWQRRKGRTADQERIVSTFGKEWMEWLAYVPPRGESMRESWIVTQNLITQFRNEVERDGRKFLLVLANNAVQVLPEEVDRRRFAEKYGLESLDYADQRLRQHAISNGIRVVWLAEWLRDLATRERAYLHGFGAGQGSGHWNEAGHRAVAGRLAAALCAP
ncbi:MAG: SGNH/GDSL hydrolase family protein [Bryobacterales bacterium]|nr:SGNH/GDSL hydrolase family protein [Bryobacterales bacterium]